MNCGSKQRKSVARRQAGCQSGRVCNFGLKSDTREMRGVWSACKHFGPNSSAGFYPPPASNDSYTPQHLSCRGLFWLLYTMGSWDILVNSILFPLWRLRLFAYFQKAKWLNLFPVSKFGRFFSLGVILSHHTNLTEKEHLHRQALLIQAIKHLHLSCSFESFTH